MAYGDSRYGATIYAGELGDQPPPPVPATAISVVQRGAIGHGKWVAQIATRGGGSVLYEPRCTSVDATYTLNGTGTGKVAVDASGAHWAACCEVMAETEPYEHELLLWRDGVLRFAGPVISVATGSQEISARDLSHWTEVRFVDDLHADGDSAEVFRMVFDNAYAKDTSPNIALTTRETGIQTTVDVLAVEFRRASDVLGSLSSYGVDWTVVGRTILAGGREVLEGGGTPLMLHDDAVISGSLSKEGVNLATDMAVFGTRLDQSQVPITGRATTGTDRYGLVQRSATDLLISDRVAADAQALARLEAMQPAARRVQCSIGDGAGFDFGDIVAGRRFATKLFTALECVAIEEEMRLQQWTVSASPDEEVTLTLVPLGVDDA